MKNLEIILKLAERCNINCTYCYVFNGTDQSYKERSKMLSFENLHATTTFLKSTILQHGFTHIHIDFHGGEPMLIGKNKFDAYCQYLTTELLPLVELDLCMQTNGILIDNEWIGLFAKHNVNVSVSLDGPAHVNDTQRIDFKNKGTYEKTVRGLKILQEAHYLGKIPEPGVLCVLNPHTSATELYTHFVHDLNVLTLDFLLPDLSHETFSAHESGIYARYLIELFNCWTKDDNPDVDIRILNSALSILLGGRSFLSGIGTDHINALTITTDGEICPDDVLRSAEIPLMKTNLFVHTHTYSDYLLFEESSLLHTISTTQHSNCLNCTWYKACGGTHPLHRFSKTNLFNNTSVYCTDMKKFLSHVSAYVLNNGIAVEELVKNLEHQPEPFTLTVN